MKKQGIILLLSLWGALGLLFGYIAESIEDHRILWLAWLQHILQVAMFALIWGWFAPALGLAKLLGISSKLYGQEILPYPINPYGWLLPIVCWYAILNMFALLKRK